MPSFDIKCEPNMVKVNNAVSNSSKEVVNRFDFKGTAAAIDIKEKEITLIGESDFQLQQLMDVLRAKFAKSEVPAEFMDIGDVQKMGGDKVKQVVDIRNGIGSEDAKKIQKLIKDSKLKVQAAIQGDVVRVTGKDRDVLQQAIALVRKEMTQLPLSFDNFRD
ncbi:YajQ family cyclic di-GMP-binding protein [Ramlibacter monticola]|uniref:Nucleotide-binding protein JJ685_06640 n=1 Tax=Ramlibacter monticola TaxID=1926872 RepID=A0A936YWL1_9BURK|nr:YajQ family cyclic di-GMP-binding protein [Ramlibacter monticola]MBL0390815.1 YajQ family cyclic di-GMP-binding protein [Ramlibacter monticola]